MCGVVGIIGKKNASSLVLEGLKKLEYRGYDSAGIASFYQKSIQVAKSEGKLVNLINKVNDLTKDPIGAYADEGQMALFLQTGDSRFLINFYDENGEIIEGVHDVKYKMIQRLIEVYNSTRSDQTTEKDLTEDQKEDAKVNDVENQKSDIEMIDKEIVLCEKNFLFLEEHHY